MPTHFASNDQTVELFCGQEKTFSQLASALGYKTFAVDRDPAVEPDLVADIQDLGPADLPVQPLLVWVRPPSHAFAGPGAWKGGEPATPEAEEALAVLGRAITLMSRMQPTWWFVETPKSPLRKNPLMAGFNRGYPTRTRQTIKHDEYGGAAGLESDIWTNAFWWLPRGGEAAPTDRSGVRGVPPMVIAEILEQLDNYAVAKASG